MLSHSTCIPTFHFQVLGLDGNDMEIPPMDVCAQGTIPILNHLKFLRSTTTHNTMRNKFLGPGEPTVLKTIVKAASHRQDQNLTLATIQGVQEQED
jgi:hypothetical protein